MQTAALSSASLLARLQQRPAPRSSAQRLRLRRRQPLAARSEQEGAPEPSTQQQAPPPEQPPQQQDEEPVWVRRERERAIIAKEGKDLPFGLYLLFSSMVAIAAVGSIFEYVNKNAVFGVLQPDSPLYTPVLALFVFTGFPTAGFLFYKSIQAANKEAERMDKVDGY